MAIRISTPSISGVASIEINSSRDSSRDYVTVWFWGADGKECEMIMISGTDDGKAPRVTVNKPREG